MAYGTVYCFNCSDEPILQLTVNGSSAGSVGGWSRTRGFRGEAEYTAKSVAVARSFRGDGPAFLIDTPTPVRLDCKSFTVQGMVEMPPSTELRREDDLILQMAMNQFTLVSPYGVVLRTIPVSRSTR
jgi:hypothetical protein